MAPTGRLARWKASVGGVWTYATACTTLLFSVCVLVGWFVSWQSGARGVFSYLLAAFDPSLAAIGMMVVGLLAPDVYAGRRFRLPHVLTIPTIYVMLLYALKSISASSTSVIRGFEGAGRYDLIWTDLRQVLATWLFLVLTLVAVGAFTGDRPDVK